MSERVGHDPKCAICGRTKKPLGRDSMDNGLCDRECDGYELYPSPDLLWPGETEAQYGFRVGEYKP